MAKVLSQDNSFQTSDASVSKTKFAKSSKEFEHQGNYYCVIDNIGFGDAKVNDKQILIRIGEAINSAYQGLSQVLFVFDGRFSDKEKEGLRKLTALKVADHYVTLVRSKFANFENKTARENDRNKMEQESPAISELINNCRGLLHLNNEDEDSQVESRALILNHLHNNCPIVFKPKEWENITTLIEAYFEEKKGLEEQKEQATSENKGTIDQRIDELESATAEKVKKEIQSKEMEEFVQLIEVGAKGIK